MERKLSALGLVCALAMIGGGSAALGEQGAGALLAVEAIEDVLPFATRHIMRDPQPGDEFPPMRILLSRSRYWAQDGHLGVVAQLDAEDPQGALRVRLLGEGGEELSAFDVSPLPGPRFIFYPALPEALAEGGRAEIEVAWRDGQRAIAEDRQAFRVEVFDESAPRSGRIGISVPNPKGVAQRGVPATVGVPFPRGTLAGTGHLRLVDEAGNRVPLQVTETARWSKFGTVKWALCDFTVDLDGGPRELFLEYGPQTRRDDAPPISMSDSDGFPVVEAGRLRFDRGIWFDAQGDGNYVQVLGEQGLSGAFVEHEDARFYRAPLADDYRIEEIGPEKVVLAREGWYVEEGGDREFCKYVIRYVIHRDSPFVRIFHTWVFTGDGNRDRIRNMGWQFALPEGFEGRGFLTSFGEDGAWASGDYLLQHTHNQFEVFDGQGAAGFPDGRATGAAWASGGGADVYFGVKDFWQNYPSEVEFRDGSLWFHNWPRHGRPARASYDADEVEEPELTRNAIRLLFAHQGETLDFRLPDEFAEPAIRDRVTGGHEEASGHWLEHESETANAQGIARTEEMWLYFAPPQADGANARRVLEALETETLRAVAEPRWVAQSGAMYEMHHQDWENYPEEESVFERVAHAPSRWQERLETYGMWIYGDVATWRLNLAARTASLYRTYRARHHGWPYNWQPFARSGDSALLKYAEAATRQLSDASFCHYFSEDVERSVGPHMSRRIGNWHRSLVPWTGRQHPSTRAYEAKVDFMLYAYYLTGYRRAFDVALAWGREAKIEDTLRRRGPVEVRRRDGITVLRSFIQMYEATFDPWYLVAAHALGEATMWAFENADWRGHFWVPADREFHRFTGCEDFVEYYLHYADYWGHPDLRASWARLGPPMIEPNVYSWMLTGDEYFLRRAAHYPAQANAAIYEADTPDYLYGFNTQGTSHMIFYGWYLQLFPTSLWAFERAGERPTPIGNKFYVSSARPEGFRSPSVAMRKEAGAPLNIRLSGMSRYSPGEEGETAAYEVVGPNGEMVLSGEWEVRRTLDVEVPADAPAGVYRARIQYSTHRGVDMPLSEVGTPEVIELAPGEAMHSALRENRYWFLVPEGVESFYIEIPYTGGARRMTVRGPDGERAWDRSLHPSIYDGPETVRAEVQVKPGQAGRLWLLTLPGASQGFVMDPQIPPYFAADATRWFMPEQGQP